MQVVFVNLIGCQLSFNCHLETESFELAWDFGQSKPHTRKHLVACVDSLGISTQDKHPNVCLHLMDPLKLKPVFYCCYNRE